MALLIATKFDIAKLLGEVISESLPEGIGYFRTKFEFMVNGKMLFEYSSSNHELNINTNNQEEIANIVSCLDRSGLTNVDVTLMLSDSPGAFPNKSTDFLDWSKWFLEFVGLYEFIVVDTNIIVNHYFSNLLFPKLGQRFESLKIRIPRLAILEIERMANDENNKVKKRLGLFAATEIMFLKNHKAELLPTLNYQLLTSFNEKAGTRKVDSWIRQEVHDFVLEDLKAIQTERPLSVLFATCDMANGLAAFSEGLNTIMFSKCEQEKYTIPDATFQNATNLAEFILNAAVAFEKICMKVYENGKTLTESYQIEGIWSGKTPYHWLNQCLRFQKIT